MMFKLVIRNYRTPQFYKTIKCKQILRHIGIRLLQIQLKEIFTYFTKYSVTIRLLSTFQKTFFFCLKNMVKYLANICICLTLQGY